MADFDITSGHVALDLVNTLDERRGAEPRELLDSYRALTRWARGAGLLESRDEKTLLAAASRDEASAERVLRRAIELREVCFSIFEAVSRRDHFPPRPLEVLHKLFYEAMKRRSLESSGTRAEWVWNCADDELDRFLWPVIDAATELVTSDDAARVRCCQGETCARLFIDNSRQGNRRWCDMKRCGNRAKVRRHYERAKSG